MNRQQRRQKAHADRKKAKDKPPPNPIAAFMRKIRGGAIPIPKLGEAVCVPFPSHPYPEEDSFGWKQRETKDPKATDHTKFLNGLLRRGYKRLGSGCYSTVLGKPGYDRVIKVTRMQDNWIDYIHWAAKKGYCGSFAPRVYSWKKFGDWSVSVVERMEQDLGNMSHADHDAKLLESLIYPANRGSLMAKLYMDDLAPGMSKFMEDFNQSFPTGTDLYGKNMMIRKDGSFCITDPVCGRSKITQTRLRTGDFSPAPITGYSFGSYYRYRMQCPI